MASRRSPTSRRFVRTNDDNDLTDHPAWDELKASSAHRLDPGENRQHDLIGVPEVAAEKPTEESVSTLLHALAVVQAVGSVCDLTVVSKFFNGNPVLGIARRWHRSVRGPRRSQALG